MDRHAVALVLEEIASLLDAAGENRFKVRAFLTAARAVDRLEADLRELVARDRLQDVRGIGPATARVIAELVATGESAYHASLRDRAPSGLRDLLRVPGLGAARIARLHAELGVSDLDGLEAAARSGRIAALRGFGERTQSRILGGLAFARGAAGRRRYHQAEEAAARLAAYIATLPGVAAVHPAGDLRRRLEIVDGLALVVVTGGDAGGAAAVVRGTPGVAWSAGDDQIIRGRLSDGLGVEVHVAAPAAAGAALVMATGSVAHIAALQAAAAERGFRLSRDGLSRDGAAVDVSGEEDVYRALGIQFVPPELRETGEEVAAAARHGLPSLVELEDLKGCFHCHTTYSDGRASIAEMAEAARARGWRYLGIADHSRSAGYAGGLAADKLRRQHREIADWNRRHGAELRLFAGVEADILADGALDYAAQGDGDVLDACDYVIGSVHSGFRTESEAMTRRIVTALREPRLTMLGHATGRLLLMRDGYPLDIERVLDAAAAAGAIVEINADPHRLDLSWQHWTSARRLGVRTAINPDAHSTGGLDNVRYGVNIARKAWLTPDDVLNAWPLDRVEAFLAERRERRGRTD
jgi:DNA polymerase (family X)